MQRSSSTAEITQPEEWQRHFHFLGICFISLILCWYYVTKFNWVMKQPPLYRIPLLLLGLILADAVMALGGWILMATFGD